MMDHKGKVVWERKDETNNTNRKTDQNWRRSMQAWGLTLDPQGRVGYVSHSIVDVLGFAFVSSAD